MTDILVDTSFLVALNNPRDKHHRRVIEFASKADANFLLPEVALTEAAFLIRREGDVPAVLSFLARLVQSQAQLQTLMLADLNRAGEIMAKYQKSRLDFVDCCIMALAERLNITQIATLDVRDFSMVKPMHAEYLELVP